MAEETRCVLRLYGAPQGRLAAAVALFAPQWRAEAQWKSRGAETLLAVHADPAVIEKYNVVSAPVAAQMALGAAKASGADIAVSVTGVAGPTGGDEVRPVGTVYLGAARDGVAYVKKLFVSRPDRALVRARAAQAALELVLRLAQGKVPAGTQALTAAQQSDDEALAALDEVFVR